MDRHEIQALDDIAQKVIDAIELNTEKLQELLERIECIDNTLDDFKEQRNESEAAFFEHRENVLGWLQKIHQQGTP